MRKIKKMYLGLILFFMYAPIFVLVAFSFNDSPTRNDWQGFTLRWYAELFTNPEIRSALFNTLIVAILSTILSVIIGTLAAISVDRVGKRKRNMIMSVSKLPVMMPDIVTGLTLMTLFLFVINSLSIGRLGLGTLLLAHVIFNIPYVMLSVMPKLRQLDPSVYEAALDLGSKPFRAFMQVVLPEIWPGVITGAMLAFTLSIDDFMVSLFTAGGTVQNLSILIFNMTRRGIDPRINALSTLTLAVIMVMLILINRRDKNLIRRRGENEAA